MLTVLTRDLPQNASLNLGVLSLRNNVAWNFQSNWVSVLTHVQAFYNLAESASIQEFFNDVAVADLFPNAALVVALRVSNLLLRGDPFRPNRVNILELAQFRFFILSQLVFIVSVGILWSHRLKQLGTSVKILQVLRLGCDSTGAVWSMWLHWRAWKLLLHQSGLLLQRGISSHFAGGNITQK